ncbi:hypothetical protein HYZ64_01650 [Candidatus Berkelbacteria bacterium]|nr:hypothetical protein [Candidatus Berkelbacteria bacterium]
MKPVLNTTTNPSLQMSPALEKLIGRVEKDITNRRHLSPAISSRGELNDYLTELQTNNI